MTDFADLAAQAPKHDPASCRREPCRRCSPQQAPHAPTVKHEQPRPTDRPDPVVRSIGLPKHPDPSSIADALEAAAKAIRTNGYDAITMANVLASRGYPASTLGDGGSRASDTTSSTERHGDPDGPHTFANIDWYYAQLLRDAWTSATKLASRTVEIIAHATDVDPTPAGTGSCRACNRLCRPTADKPGNRLIAGLCPTCYKAWQRYRVDGPMLWSEWVAKRREGYSERDTTGRLIAIHTPEPDHEIDLSRDRPADIA